MTSQKGGQDEATGAVHVNLTVPICVATCIHMCMLCMRVCVCTPGNTFSSSLPVGIKAQGCGSPATVFGFINV